MVARVCYDNIRMMWCAHTSVFVGVEKVDGGVELLFGQQEGLASCRAVCRAAEERRIVRVQRAVGGLKSL